MEKRVFEMRGSNLVGVHVKEHGRMEQRTRMQQSHRVITHRNSTYARATTRSRSLLLGRHVAARKVIWLDSPEALWL